LKEKSFHKWAIESFDAGKDFIYNNINEGDLPSDAYISKGTDIAQRQMALAAYRLVQVLTDLYASKASDLFLS